jgi:hypothetical protein
MAHSVLQEGRSSGTMTLTLFEAIRDGCREVAERATFVRIDEGRIAAYAASLPLDQARAPQLDLEHHFLGAPEETVAYILTLDAVNFGSGYFPHLRKRLNLSGYFTIATSLKERFETRGALTADELGAMSPQACAGLFGQSLNNDPAMELMGLFATAWNDLGRLVGDRFGGRFAGLVEAAGSSAERLVELLAAMPLFDDVQPYGELSVPFYKRAQLTAADLALTFGRKDYGLFVDLDRLTIFADNLVPHVLRVDGLLRYDPDLATRIDAEEPIPAGSSEEVEIRATALHTVELLVAELHRNNQPIAAMELDYLLWNRGQQPVYKARPRHRTRTVFY